MKMLPLRFMGYTEQFRRLQSIFSTAQSYINIPGSEISISNMDFHSDTSLNDYVNRKDSHITENSSFSYPVFIPADKTSDKVIILLHGLNEKSWIKYLTWAYSLAESTGSYIVLFPISFHINRCPGEWKDPRAMSDFMKSRNSDLGNIEMSSFANVALSNRLTEDPMRFLYSGYQTLTDIVKLLKTIRAGAHPVIPGTDNFNFFAYSIGAFLAEVILLGNPEKLLTGSRLFIFSGGSVFSNMRGTSRLIMDRLAFERIFSFYMTDFEKSISEDNPMTNFLRSNEAGIAFRSMIDLERFKSFRESIFKKLKGQIHAISLTKDTVIPATGVVNTLSSWDRGLRDTVEVWDFPYPYSHENPFPVLNTSLSQEVDRCFDSLFLKAKVFFQ
jgi:hypothetical protein